MSIHLVSAEIACFFATIGGGFETLVTRLDTIFSLSTAGIAGISCPLSETCAKTSDSRRAVLGKAARGWLVQPCCGCKRKGKLAPTPRKYNSEGMDRYSWACARNGRGKWRWRLGSAVWIGEFASGR